MKYDESHIEKCFSDILGYLKSKGLTDQANVIKIVYESKEKAKYLNNVLERKKNPEKTTMQANTGGDGGGGGVGGGPRTGPARHVYTYNLCHSSFPTKTAQM